MKKLLLAFVFAVLPSIAYAQNGYVEGSIGLLLLPDVNTHDYVFNTPSGLFAGNAEAEYGGDWSFGLEGGYQTGPWRFGLSWDLLNSEVNKARLEGTLNGAPFSSAVTDQQLEDFGIGANNDVSVFALNAYYTFNSFDLGTFARGIQPYVGLGAGVATYNSASSEFAFLVSVGANYTFAQGFYLGARYRFIWTGGPTSDTNIKFDGVTAHVFSLVLGYKFPV